MKSFLVMALSLLLCSIGVMAQDTDTKPVRTEFMNQHHKHAILPKGEEHEMQHPDFLKSPKGNQFKSAQELTQKLDSMIIEFWDSTASQWVDPFTTAYTYDGNGNNNLAIAYLWDGYSNQSVPLWKNEYTYDANGNNTLDILYERNANNNLIAWRIDEYIYDASGKVTLDSISYWDPYANYWLHSGKFEYTYDANANCTSKIFYYWADSSDWNDSSQWIPSYKQEYTYDDNGNMILASDYTPVYFVDNQLQWNIRQKTAYSFDANGNMTMDSTYYLDEINSRSLNFLKNEHAYNAKRNIISTIGYLWYESPGQWAVKTKTTYYYSGQNPTLIPKIPENHISVYPNPASGYVIFDGMNVSESATVELFNIEGKKVLEQKLPENREISVGSLPKGLYLYRLKDNGKSFAGKITIE
jgi:hypothetical protein